MNLQIKQKFLILPTILYQCCIYPFQSALQLIFQGLWEKKVSDKEYFNLSQLDKVLQILVSYKHVPIPSTNSKKKEKKKKLETINKPPRLLIFVLFDSCLVSTPLFQCKAKNHTRTRFLKRAAFWTSHKANKSDYGLCQLTPFQVTLAKLGPQCIYHPDLTHLGLLAIT